jgi:hypothetical protein
VSAYLDGVRRLCRELLNAKERGELTLDAKTQQRLEDIERERYQLATERVLLATLAAAPDPAYRQRYLELVRAELGIDLLPTLDVAHIDESETRAQGTHDVAWSHFDRLLAQGVRCKASAHRAWETGTAHMARLGVQLNYLRTFL